MAVDLFSEGSGSPATAADLGTVGPSVTHTHGRVLPPHPQGNQLTLGSNFEGNHEETGEDRENIKFRESKENKDVVRVELEKPSQTNKA